MSDQEKRKIGRPTDYRADYHPEHAYRYCLLGATNDNLAEFFNIGITTLERWIAKYDEFRGAIKEAKEIADARVAERLYNRAIGYAYTETSREYVEGEEDDEGGESGQSGKIKVKVTNKQLAPDVTAQIFWLKNRQRDKWRDAKNLNHGDSDGKNLKTGPITFTLTGVKPEDP